MELKEEKQLIGTRLPAKEGGVRRLLERRLPILVWARSYTGGDALADLVAGLTLGLTLVPQSIAYASLAKVPLHYGLYTSFMGSMVYVLLGTVKEVSIGLTSLMALLTAQVCAGLPLAYVPLLTFLSGAVVLLMGLLRLGFLVDLISGSVTLGFTSGTSVLIIASQLKGLVGAGGGGGVWRGAGAALGALVGGQARAGDAGLSAACCTVLVILRKVKDVQVPPKRPRLRTALWLLSISRNALVVLAASLLAYFTRGAGETHPYFTLSGVVTPGLPAVSLPRFWLPPTNSTPGGASFPEMVGQLGSGLLYVPVTMVLANIAIAKAFSPGGVVDATQEMLTLGACNLAGALLGALPACGAFTRSAVSHSSGVRTPLAGLYSGTITLLATAFLTPYFYYIPKACLSSVLICAVIFMIDVQGIVRVYRESRWELFVVLVSVGGVTWSPAGGLAAGAAAALLPACRALLRPPLTPTLLRPPLTPTLLRPPLTPTLLRPPLTPTLLRPPLTPTLLRPPLTPTLLRPPLTPTLLRPPLTPTLLRPPLTPTLPPRALHATLTSLLYLSAPNACAKLLSYVNRVNATTLLVDCSLLTMIDYNGIQELKNLNKKLKNNDQQLILYKANEFAQKELEKVKELDLSAITATSASEALSLAGVQNNQTDALNDLKIAS